MKKTRNNTTKPLAELVYNKAIREEIEERVASKYLKRIDYLVGANNELMNELEHWEKEIITVSKESVIEEVKNETATTR